MKNDAPWGRRLTRPRRFRTARRALAWLCFREAVAQMLLADDPARDEARLRAQLAEMGAGTIRRYYRQTIAAYVANSAAVGELPAWKGWRGAEWARAGERHRRPWSAP